MYSEEKLFSRLSKWLRDISTGRMVMLSLLIFLLFTAIVLPGQAAVADELSGAAGTPDLSFYYSADDLYRMAEAYGDEGRSEYIRARFTFDLVWPLVYAFFMVMSLSWLTKKLFAPESRWQFANLIPAFGADLDYLENVATSIVMARFPSLTPYLANIAGFATSMKWIVIAGGSLLLLALALMVLWKKARAKADNFR